MYTAYLTHVEPPNQDVPVHVQSCMYMYQHVDVVVQQCRWTPTRMTDIKICTVTKCSDCTVPAPTAPSHTLIVQSLWLCTIITGIVTKEHSWTVVQWTSVTPVSPSAYTGTSTYYSYTPLKYMYMYVCCTHTCTCTSMLDWKQLHTHNYTSP